MGSALVSRQPRNPLSLPAHRHSGSRNYSKPTLTNEKKKDDSAGVLITMALHYMYVFGILFARNSTGNVLPSKQPLVDRICRLCSSQMKRKLHCKDVR
jgi:hypothetical protein